MEAIRSSETSVHTRSTQRHIPEDGILHSHRCENLKSYTTLGRAVAQAVSRWLPTAEAQVRVRVACGVCGGQSGIGADFLRVLRFPLPIIPPISPSS
jgi:hypothetical protein